jgi:hypothetical protein
MFDVYESKHLDVIDDGLNLIDEKSIEFHQCGCNVREIMSLSGDDTIAIISATTNKRGRSKTNVSINYTIFTNMLEADPTPNKICLQWLLNTFTQLLKQDKFNEAIRFYSEDLPKANKYLTLFESNKRKNKFKEFGTYNLKGIVDLTNINEYRSLSQLFNAVDPFIERNPTELEAQILKYVEMGKGEIPFKDSKYTVFIPLCRDASTIFNNLSGWCTSQPKNGMFSNYTSNNKRPDGTDSKLYIIIDNDFFTDNSNKIYQLHFETRQFMDRSNSKIKDIVNNVLSHSEGLSNYLYEELIKLGTDFKGSLMNNNYFKVLLDFGFTEVIFDFFDIETPVISIDSETSTFGLQSAHENRVIRSLPDISRFKALSHLVIIGSGLEKFHPSIKSLENLKNLTLAGNNISEIPSEFSGLKSLLFLNLWDNPIEYIPSDIKYLDSSNGGKLLNLIINKDKISNDNYLRLKELLPTVSISTK